MADHQYRIYIRNVLAKAGIEINGNNPWDMQIHNEKFYRRAIKYPSLGVGESYVEGWWDCQALDEFFFRVTRHIHWKEIYSLRTFLRCVMTNFFSNQQSKVLSHRVAKQHYNLDNDLYRHMLGDTMAYTCAYWKNSTNLNDAQNAKFDLICRKAQLQPGEKVLELGCGWGGFSRFAAQNYGVEIVAVNIAGEQVKYAREICRDLAVTVHQCDYRDVGCYNSNKVAFDKVISIGMCEHVGYKNYRQFFEIVGDNLKPDGLFLLHTIGKNITTYFGDPWIQKYIFPGGMLPTIKLLSKTAESQFIIEDLQNFGSYYDLTLQAWERNFVNAWPTLQNHYDERFYRMWRYYLLSCAGAFRARSLQLWQLVLSPKGAVNGYISIR